MVLSINKYKKYAIFCKNRKKIAKKMAKRFAIYFKIQ